MLLIVGLFIIPIVILIIIKSNLVTTKKKNKILLNILLVVISIVYGITCLIVRTEPFNFEDHYSKEYMIYTGEYFFNFCMILLFTPFVWIIVVNFASKLFRSIKIRKNAIIKKDDDFIFYRGDLDKISPSTIMFVSMFDLDFKKCIASTILKLKLSGYIKEKNGVFEFTKKSDESLIESEKMVLGLIKSKEFDKTKYKKAIEKEALKNKYIVKNGKGIFTRLLRIVFLIILPIIIFKCSIALDDYVFDYYHVIPEDDGHAYLKLEKEKDVRKLEKELKTEDDLYHSEMYDGRMSYTYNYVRADKFGYSLVRKGFFLNIFTIICIIFSVFSVLISAYFIIKQFVYLNKNYRRTIKGNILLNKAYALKNYLKEYSLIKDRTEKELILWEYYLIYAVSLDVNEKIEEDIIEKYVKDIV